MRLHKFTIDISGIPLPAEFTFPFHYTPHPLCVIAADEVHRYLQNRHDWHEELQKGKMFGVLIVQDNEGQTGYLAAFSGNLAQSNNHTYFVPPVFDMLAPEGFFRKEEERISAINDDLRRLENDCEYIRLQTSVADQTEQSDKEIRHYRNFMKEAKKQREIRRSQSSDPAITEMLIRESQFQKAELKRLERRCRDEIAQLRFQLQPFEERIEKLRYERKVRSATLQQQLFDSFRVLNGKGEEKGLSAIFENTVQRIPPAGAGECAGPKLLQYAFRNHLKPIAMAEFWWGDSPKTEIRCHGHYYPACKGKCEPILNHMLQGIQVEANPLLTDHHLHTEPEILYEDQWLIAVYKPAGLLSVPGRNGHNSVYEAIRRRFPDTNSPLSIHRLDMATSGVLLLAKDKDVHKQMQALFKNHKVAKRYIALLDGIPEKHTGTIELPLMPNLLDRPRQQVSFEHGKHALTRYEVLETNEGRTRVAFYPHTGRTHQLRVHAAHSLGLGCPIIGDELYGRKDKRLFLHAESIDFQHPITGIKMHIEKISDF